MGEIPVFEYRASSKAGEQVTGSIEAPSRSVATVRLRQQGYWIEALREAGRPDQPGVGSGAAADHSQQKAVPSRWSFLYGLFPVSAGVLSTFFTQLGGLYKAGVGMQTSLEQMAAGALSPRIRAFLTDARGRVAQGEALSACMLSHPQVFQAGVAGMVRAGELTGNLDELCRDLAEEFLAEQRARWLMVIPRLYFLAVIFLASLVLSFPWFIKYGLHWWVVHITADILPWWLAAGILWLVLKVVWWLPPVLKLRDWLAYTIPVWSGLTRRVALYRFYRSLELTVRAGVDFSVGLATAALAAGNRIMVRQLLQASDLVRNGMPLHEALARCRFLPAGALSNLGIAAVGGSFDEMLPTMSEQAKHSRDTYVRILRTGVVAAGYAITTTVVIIVVVLAFISIYKAQFERAGFEDLMK